MALRRACEKEARRPGTVMSTSLLYPLTFSPIFQYRLWGGRGLARWFDAPLPGEDRIGEAWVLSDRDDYPSRVAEGPLAGLTIAQLIARARQDLLGRLSARFNRFPLLLKFLDVEQMLSVQVHPPDAMESLIPKGESGKTEAWVILEAKEQSRIYAGLKPGATTASLRALSRQTVAENLASFRPQVGEAVLIEAGTVHSLGDGVVVVEVQENSDVTYRLYDWDHIDPKTGERRPLQIEQALACVDFKQGAINPLASVVEEAQSSLSERLLQCSHFQVWRIQSSAPFTVGEADAPRILVCLDGAGSVEHASVAYPLRKGGVMLLAACLGQCRFQPQGAVTILEIGVPAL